MKKVLLITVGFLILIIFLLIVAVVYSFSTIKPATQAINEELAQYFSKVIYIPKGIPPPIQDFNETIYFWEMETPDKEVVGIRLKYDTALTKDQKTIRLTLEKEEKGDPSIFNKVLPAVIADKQSLDSARDPQKANLSGNPDAGYNNIKLSVLPQSGQTVQVVWEFEKSKLEDNLVSKYNKLTRVPEPLLRFLYTLPHFILSLFSA